jgi:hypothetical protein
MPRPRISISTALLLLTIAGMAIVIVQLWREIGPLRHEVAKLRTEQGLLVVEDSTKVHAIQLPSLVHDGVWKFRVYIPSGGRFRAVLVVNKIPYSGLPSVPRPLRSSFLGPITTGTFADMDDGEHLLTVGEVKGVDGRPCIVFERYGPGARRLSNNPRIDDQTWPRKVSGNVAEVNGVSDSTQIAESKGELVLIRLRRIYQSEGVVSYGPYDDGTLADGFMLWIEPISEPVAASK